MKNSEIVHDLLQVNRELPIGPEINQDTLTRPSQNLSLDVGLQPFIQPQTVHVSGKMARNQGIPCDDHWNLFHFGPRVQYLQFSCQ